MNYQLSDAKTLVVKLGSALLVDSQSGSLHQEWLSSFIEDLVHCWQRGQRVVLVSSGATALGRRHLRLKNLVLPLQEKQAAAAVGQIKLAQAYQSTLAEHGITAAQVLLTMDDSENRQRYLNAKNTLETLLNLGAIPVINENDTVATAKSRFGDNDRLAARVAQMISADTLVLLSDVDGLYTANPSEDPKATRIPVVNKLTPEIIAMAGEPSSSVGSGGMITKLAAAKIALASGCRMVIAEGKPLHPLKRIDEVDSHTWFIPELNPAKARKNWIAQHLQPKGTMVVDQGAMAALKQGKSLLSVGVVAIQGDFHQGDAICILDQNQQELGRGLSNFAAHECKKILGRKSSDFEAILGYQTSDEIVHRDDLALLQE